MDADKIENPGNDGDKMDADKIDGDKIEQQIEERKEEPSVFQRNIF